MWSIDQLLGGVEPSTTLIYLPKHTKTSAENTPLLEMMLAGQSFELSFPEVVQKAIFTEIGVVLSFRLVYDRETGKPKGTFLI